MNTDYTALVNQQKHYFNTGVTKLIEFRIAQLKKLRLVLKNNETDLYNAIYNDVKKSEFETYTTELSVLYGEIDEAISKVKKWSTKKRVKTNLVNFPALSYIMPEPLGTTLVIGAWNYPYQLSLAPAIAAIAAGNTVIIKPSELAHNAAQLLEKIINENFNPEFLTVINGGVETTTALLQLKFDKLFFTGSATVGKIVYQAAAAQLTPITLELGGKSPAFITKNCTINDSAKRLVWAKFLNAGQTCIAPDYVLVDSTMHDQFLTAVKFYIQKYNYAFENNNYVQIINDKNFTRLINLIDTEKVYCGGNHIANERYIAPTVITNVTFNDKIMQEEIFGPLLPIISYTNLNDAIQQVKQLPKPLSCYVFTNDSAIKETILNEISFGGGAVNDAIMHFSNSALPFGGVGSSGIGSYHAEYGFKAFSHYKSILHKSFWFEPNLKYPPYSLLKLNWIKRLVG